MRPSVAVSSLILGFAVQASAQSPAAVTRGATIRISTHPVTAPGVQLPSTQVIGTYEAFRSDTIYLTAAGSSGTPQYYATRNIKSLERSLGQRHPYFKGALFTGTLGAALGYGVGRIIKPGQRCFQPSSGGPRLCLPPDPAKTGYKWAAPVGASVGIVTGLAIGHRMLRHVWEAVPVATLR